MKGLVNSGGSLCGLRCAVFWQAVIKPSSSLTARRLFTADVNFPNSPLAPYPSLCLPQLALCLPLCLHSPLCRRSLSPLLLVSAAAQSHNPVSTGDGTLSGKAQPQSRLFFPLHKSICFTVIHFLTIYAGLGGKESSVRLGNFVCDLINLAQG